MIVLMKWKWAVIVMVVMFTMTRNAEERNNPITLLKILFERGVIAWIELIVMTVAIVLPSVFITKALERISSKLYPHLFVWKSIFFAVCATVICYIVVMALLEPIKNV
jgi:hypothetical protein